MFLERIERSQPLLNAFITVTRERALADARESERRIQKQNSHGLLDGIPIVLKDNIWTAGIKTTAGSKILGDFVPEQDATVAARLRRAGVVLLGKTNMHEFAYGVTTENPHFGAAHNQWEL
jgi:aspartyl-tRNA(Asn)/glutamyl-tRNA(Gln) amidotransferase subunit A